jgi:hypothetical protein
MYESIGKTTSLLVRPAGMDVTPATSEGDGAALAAARADAAEPDCVAEQPEAKQHTMTATAARDRVSRPARNRMVFLSGILKVTPKGRLSRASPRDNRHTRSVSQTRSMEASSL